ncbi:MAG: hypothetical protein Q8P13_04335 [bacterium]|nr:hypothetical protein [bacterium]
MLFKVNLKAVPARRLRQILKNVGLEVSTNDICFNDHRVGGFNYASGNLLGFTLEEATGEVLKAWLSRNEQSSRSRRILRVLGLTSFLGKWNQDLKYTDSHPFGEGIFIGPLPKEDSSAYPGGAGTVKTVSLRERLSASKHLTPRQSRRRVSPRK